MLFIFVMLLQIFDKQIIKKIKVKVKCFSVEIWIIGKGLSLLLRLLRLMGDIFKKEINMV